MYPGHFPKTVTAQEFDVCHKRDKKYFSKMCKSKIKVFLSNLLSISYTMISIIKQVIGRLIIFT